MQASRDELFDERWERAVVAELNREHGSTFFHHKVQLRPVTIMLFDSDRLWGKFESRSRTISISRALVKDHPWHHVLGVFNHEIAHQLVEEERPKVEATLSADQTVDPSSHGPEFKAACRRLGIPAQYARAGLDLNTCSLDWRAEKTDPASEKILDRVRKLLALASSTNEHEALLAMERVRELYARHNLDHLNESGQKEFVHLVISHGKKRMEAWEQRTISILIEHFFVQVLTFRQFNAQTREKVHAFEIIGTRENVLMAEYVYYFLLQQSDFLLKGKVKSGVKLFRSEKKSFRLGVLAGFSEKLAAAEKAPQSKPQNAATGPGEDESLMSWKYPGAQFEKSLVGQALDVFRKSPTLDNYMSEIYPRISRRSGSTATVSPDAYLAGQNAGKSIMLNKPISASGESNGRGLRLSNGKS